MITCAYIYIQGVHTHLVLGRWKSLWYRLSLSLSICLCFSVPLSISLTHACMQVPRNVYAQTSRSKLVCNLFTHNYAHIGTQRYVCTHTRNTSLSQWAPLNAYIAMYKHFGRPVYTYRQEHQAAHMTSMHLHIEISLLWIFNSSKQGTQGKEGHQHIQKILAFKQLDTAFQGLARQLSG